MPRRTQPQRVSLHCWADAPSPNCHTTAVDRPVAELTLHISACLGRKAAIRTCESEKISITPSRCPTWSSTSQRLNPNVLPKPAWFLTTAVACEKRAALKTTFENRLHTRPRTTRTISPLHADCRHLFPTTMLNYRRSQGCRIGIGEQANDACSVHCISSRPTALGTTQTPWVHTPAC